MSSRGSKSKAKSKGSKDTQSKPIESDVGSEHDKGSEHDMENSGDGSDDVVVVDETAKTVDGHTCRSCKGPDTEEMVQCDQCDGWYHYNCVGVTDEVINQSWSCTNCKTAKWIQRTTMSSSEHSTPIDTRKEHKSKRTLSVMEASTTTPISSSKGKAKSAQSDPLVQSGATSGHLVPEPSRPKYQPAPLQKPGTVHQSSDKRKEKIFVPSVDGLPTIELEKAFSEVSCTSSQRSARNRAKLQLLRLQEEREFEKQQAERRRAAEKEEAERRRVAEEEEAEKHKEFLAKKYKILESLASERGSVQSSSSIISLRRVEEWIENTNCTQLEETRRSSRPAAQMQDRREPSEEEHQTSEQPCQHQQEEELRQQEQYQRQQQQLQQQRLRQQHQEQRQREEEFRRYQQQMRNEHQKQAKLLLEQQRKLHQEEDRINQLRKQQLQEGRWLREKIRADRTQAGNVLETERGQSGHFSPEALPQSTLVQPNVNHPSRSAVDPNQNASDTPRTGGVQTLLRNSTEGDYEQFQLSRSQIAARQAVSKDLPTFSGNPEEWPIFLSMFNSTTAMCGFTEEENLVRLQRSLDGKAYEAVKCRLMHAGNLDGVMDTLRMLYGQPEVIVHSLIGKISSLPAIREDRLETLVDFAVSVQNFCATVDSCGLKDYMYNVTLLHQLVSKLPPSIKLNWAQHRKTLVTVNLATFGEWIYSLAEAASSVTLQRNLSSYQRNQSSYHARTTSLP